MPIADHPFEEEFKNIQELESKLSDLTDYLLNKYGPNDWFLAASADFMRAILYLEKGFHSMNEDKIV